MMPTFLAVALDRLLEPGDSKSNPPTAVAKRKDDLIPSSRLDRRNTTPFLSDDSKSSSKRHDIPPPHPKLRRRNSVAYTAAPETKPPPRPLISPALYATPESTPLPDSPTSSFSPSSPYIINHKRRGPRLLKSFSERNLAVVAAEKDDNGGDTGSKLVNGHSRSFSEEDVPRERKEQIEEEKVNRHFSTNLKVKINAQEVETNGSNANMGQEDVELKVVSVLSPERDGRETDDFYDPPESMSFSSNTDGDDYGVDLMSARMYTPMGEFFDAWEELSSDSGRQAQRTPANVDTELREMRLSLLMEIEKRKHAEEALNSMCGQWQMLREKLWAVGLILPAELPASLEDCQSDVDPAEEICRQIHVARSVSESIGRGMAKAEAEAEMEAQLEMKNFEIARLYDRLHYYETMNREMSHRNQEAIEVARRERQKRRRRQKWVWGSIAAAITLGSAALAWSYLPNGRGSYSSNSLETSDIERDAQ